MIVTCPICATRFLIDPRALGATGRTVRCTQCNHVWMQLPAEDAPRRVDLQLPGLDRPMPRTPPQSRPLPPPAVPPPPAFQAAAPLPVLEEEPPPVPQRPPPSPRRETEPVYAAAAAAPAGAAEEDVVRGSNRPLVFAVAAAAVLALLWYGHDFLVDRIPALDGVYAAVGLGAGDPRDDLEVRALTSKRKQLDGRPTVVIDGEVANVSNVSRRVPPLRITLEDSGRHPIKSWTVVATHDRLSPGQSVPFHASVADPGGTTVGASVSFDGGTE